MSISYTCSLFGYNRQVYYRAKKKRKNSQQLANQVIQLVQSVRRRMPRLGTKKLYVKLNKELRGLGVGRDKLFDILRANHLLIKPKRQYHITTNSHHRFRKHKNLVEGLELKRPEQVWVSDITYIGSRECPRYLALVTDSYSKKILGYDVSDSLAADGTLRALKMAISNRKYKAAALIHHSDRGLQYCSNEYQKVLNDWSIKCSMTEQYDPYQNATAERINGILKQEFLFGIKVTDIELLRTLVKDCINIYNTERPHLSCRMNTPDFMHKQSAIKIKTYKTKRVKEINPSLVN